MKAIFEFEVGEPKQKIGFKFGTMALGITQRKEGKSLKQILEQLASGKVDTLTLLNILYGAAVQYADSKGKEGDFSVSDVSDWCEEIGFSEMQEVISKGLNQYVPKNSTSPAPETGEKITA
jgi:hypothetical protein